MFRLPAVLIKSRCLLIQSHPSKILSTNIHQSGSWQIYKKVTQRELCPQAPPPPPPPPKSRAWLYKSLLALAVTGGFVVYAKSNPEVRDWMSIYAPWFDDFIAVAYQESDTYDQSITKFLRWTGDKIDAYINAPPLPKECVKESRLKFLACKGKDKKTKDTKKEEKEKEKEEEHTEESKRPDGIIECHPPAKAPKSDAVAKEGAPPPPPPPPAKTDNLPALQKCMEETSATIVEYYDMAKDACITYRSMADDEIAHFNHDSMEKLQTAIYNRMEVIEDAKEKIQFAKKKMKGLQRVLECIKASDEERSKMLRQFHHLADIQDHAKHQYKIENEKAESVDQQFELKYNPHRSLARPLHKLVTILQQARATQVIKQFVKTHMHSGNSKRPTQKKCSKRLAIMLLRLRNTKATGRLQNRMKGRLEKFQAEIKIIGNGLDFNKEKLEFNGDPDLLLYHVMRYEKMLKQEMVGYIASNERKIHKGVERMPPQTEESRKRQEVLTKKAIEDRLADYEKDIKKRTDKHRAKNEHNLKEALRVQTEKQQENFEKKLAQREQELMNGYHSMVADKVNAQKAVFQEELNEVRKKLRQAESQLCGQLERDSEVRKARELYTASSSILSATNTGGKVTKVDQEIKTIKNVAALDDKLTHSVIDALPESVARDGVVPEAVLFNQFHSMEKTARQVALVERDGGPLPVFILSWIQSLLLFMRMSGIPTVEAEKPPDPPYDHLDTFDLLQRARYWIAHRNLKQAVLYVQELKGASHAVAEKWLKDARTHLEAKQAAEAISAHAAAQTLKHV